MVFGGVCGVFDDGEEVGVVEVLDGYVFVEVGKWDDIVVVVDVLFGSIVCGVLNELYCYILLYCGM